MVAHHVHGIIVASISSPGKGPLTRAEHARSSPMATRDPFVHLERLYAEALLRHYGRFAEPPAAPRNKISRRRLLIRLLPYLLLAAAAGAVFLRDLFLASWLILLASALRPIGRRLDLAAPTVGGAGVELLIDGLLLLALTVLPGLLPPLGIFFTLRTLYLVRGRIQRYTDRATVRLELGRLARGAEPRIYGLADERHGGDARRLAHYGEEIARLRASTR